MQSAVRYVPIPLFLVMGAMYELSQSLALMIALGFSFVIAIIIFATTTIVETLQQLGASAHHDVTDK